MALHDPMLDIGYAAAEAFLADEANRVPVILGQSLEAFNKVFARRRTATGDVFKIYPALGSLGNAQMADLTTKHTSNINNVVREGQINWARTITNWSYNRIAVAMASQARDEATAARRVFDYMKPIRAVAIKEMAELIQEKMFLPPASSSDNLSPIGIAGGWLALGSSGSEGDFTGYQGTYLDGTNFNVAGIACSSSINPLWASYYADHQGKLGDYLLYLIDKAQDATRLYAPEIPETAGRSQELFGPDMVIFTTLNVLTNLKSFVRKAGGDTAGFAEVRNGRLYINNVPVIRAPVLETARPSVYGTDPVVGVNLDKLTIGVLEADNFFEGNPRQRDEQPDWYTIDISVTWAVASDDRRGLGFLISQHA